MRASYRGLPFERQSSQEVDVWPKLAANIRPAHHAADAGAAWTPRWHGGSRLLVRLPVAGDSGAAGVGVIH